MTPRATSAAGLRIIGASAGTGKTYRITREIEDAVTATGPTGVRLDGLVAVTYTRKAHIELESRIRRALLKTTTPERAAELPQASVGTVHSVCLRWIREFAIDAGLFPHVEVLADADLALAQVIEEMVPGPVRTELDELAERLQTYLNPNDRQWDWCQPVEDIIALARGGRIAPTSLPGMAERSSMGLLQLFARPTGEASVLDQAVVDAVDRALGQIDVHLDETVKTHDAVETLKEFQRSSAHGRPTWAQWASLAKLDAGAASRDALGDVRASASAWEIHPALRSDLRRFTELVFQAAASTLERYAEWKRERGLVDYVDMIEHALVLLENDDIASDLGEKLQLVVVDELQDSSPVQLALFLRLHALAQRSTWVGDPKQCIFEYAGADPALMRSVLRWASSSGTSTEIQSTSYRARPALVEITNAVFAGVFVEHGMRADETVVSAARAQDHASALERLPPLGVFYFTARKQSEHAQALAAGVARILGSPNETPIIDPIQGTPRPVRPGDIAILVATNREGEQISGALAACGIRSTFSRSGLIGTPEATVTAAALRYLLDERDSHAMAELEALHGWGCAGADAWLSRRLESLEAGPPCPPRPGWCARLDDLRPRVAALSPCEAVERVLVALDLPMLASSWPNPQQRLANLDAIRSFARLYEQRCTENGTGCSVPGLLRFFGSLTQARYRHGETRREDEQYSGRDEKAVTVMTYHRSKGLEWPVVILASLDRDARPAIFDVAPQSETEDIDPDDPLAGRWIRYWPWPFGRTTAPALQDAADRSAVGVAEKERERRERARLLYVGFTRARDHLVLAARLAGDRPQCRWLDELTHNGLPAIVLCSHDATTPKVEIGRKLVVLARMWQLDPSPPAGTTSLDERLWFSRVSTARRPEYAMRPSAVKAGELEREVPAVSWLDVINPHRREETRGDVDSERVGSALHAFLAADSAPLERTVRTQLAARLIEGYGVSGACTPESFLATSDAFSAFIAARLPGATWAREIPIEAPVDSPYGVRRIIGRIDLLLETEAEFIVVDHKSFPATNESALREKAQEFAPQLATYAAALRVVRPGKRISGWIHFAAAGAIVGFDEI